jgi:hypothetical protein
MRSAHSATPSKLARARSTAAACFLNLGSACSAAQQKCGQCAAPICSSACQRHSHFSLCSAHAFSARFAALVRHMAPCPCELDASSAAAAVVLPLGASGAAPSTGLEAPDAAADAAGVCAPADAPLDSAAAAARCEASEALERTRDSEATAGEAPGALEPAAAPLREEPDDMRHAYRRAGRSASGVGGWGRSAVYRAVRLPRALRVEVVRGRMWCQGRSRRTQQRISPCCPCGAKAADSRYSHAC